MEITVKQWVTSIIIPLSRRLSRPFGAVPPGREHDIPQARRLLDPELVDNEDACLGVIGHEHEAFAWSLRHSKPDLSLRVTLRVGGTAADRAIPHVGGELEWSSLAHAKRCGPMAVMSVLLSSARPPVGGAVTVPEVEIIQQKSTGTSGMPENLVHLMAILIERH